MSNQPSSDNQNTVDFAKYSGFFKKSIEERRHIINSTDEESQRALDGELDTQYADKMIENMVGKLTIPVGICPYLLLNGEHYTVPMATEEPSVIAAASSATKLVAEMGGGFTARSSPNIVNTQIQFTYSIDSSDTHTVDPIQLITQTTIVANAHALAILSNKEEIITAANGFCPRMVARGGGVVNLRVRVIPPKMYTLQSHTIDSDQWNLLDALCIHTADRSPPPHTPQCPTETPPNLPSLCVYLSVNVCDAMGANLVNTIAEGIAPVIHQKLSPVEPYPFILPSTGLRILSNLCVERITTVEFSIPIDKLAWKTASGREVAEGIVKAFYFAQNDVFRAVTHNKGVMNGITAVALATGQDTRAIEAGIHAFCSVGTAILHNGSGSEQDVTSPHNAYQPVTRYWIDTKQDTLCGKIAIPIAVGTKGGAIHQHPLFHWSLRTLKDPSAVLLAQIIAAVGLAQNLAAIRALAVEGIQRGHMQLHHRKEEGQ